MAKLFLASEVVFKRFGLGVPEFKVALTGRIDGKGERKTIVFEDKGKPEETQIAQHILGLLRESYKNAKAKMGEGKFYIALTVDDACENILPPPAQAPLAKGGGAEATVEVERTIIKETERTSVTVRENHGPKPEARGPHGP